MNKIKLITQTHKERQWKKVDSGFIDKLKYFATFGVFGRLEWVVCNERDVTVFVTVFISPKIDDRVYQEFTPRLEQEFTPRLEPVRPFLRQINCRCKITKL